MAHTRPSRGASATASVWLEACEARFLLSGTAHSVHAHSAPAVAPAGYTIVDLSVLADAKVTPEGINDAGQVVGGGGASTT